MNRSKSARTRFIAQPFLCLGLFISALALMAGSSFVPFAGASTNTQEARPRRSVAPTPKPTGTTTTTRSGSTQTPASGSTQTPTSRPTATPTPTKSPTPYDRIAPQLGEPPPVPVLKPKPTPTPEEPVISEGDVLKINTDLVTLNVRVIDRNNRPVSGVRQEDFHVFEDNEPQPIESFSKEEVPISYGLAVDTSGSLRSQLLSVIDAAKTIINSNRTGDETFLVRFISSDKIETVQDFTPSQELMIDALDNLYVEGGQTAIIDAVYLSAEHVAEYKKGDDNDRRRRALIVITDGEDRNSFYKQDQLFQKLREEDVQIFVIGFVNELDKEGGLIRKSPRERAVNLINKLATETGGRAFFPQSLSELPEISNQIVRDLRTQYVIAYNPTNKTRDGSYRAIKVNVEGGSSGDKRIALTRSGRIAAREGPSGPKPPPVRIPAPKTSMGTRP
jgi:Ca-activated chloride channel homolog